MTMEINNILKKNKIEINNMCKILFDDNEKLFFIFFEGESLNRILLENVYFFFFRRIRENVYITFFFNGIWPNDFVSTLYK